MRSRDINELGQQVQSFPKAPGVYLMKDEGGEIIYIGKAKDLRARVRSYFGAGDGRVQIEFLMRRVVDIDRIVTESEDQAVILERDLINRHKPRYNIRLKDDKAYLNIRIDPNNSWPRIELIRRVEQDGAIYYGPFVQGLELRELLEVVKNVLPLRTCADTVLHNRQRPCLEYQIKRCSGPCCLPVDRDEYNAWVTQAISIIEGKIAPVVARLSKEMNEAAHHLRFEEAAALRDRIAVLKRYSEGQSMISHRGESRDAFALYRSGSQAALCVLSVKSGRISDSHSYTFPDVHVEDEELLESALTQYYQKGREIPEEVLLPHTLANQSMLRRYLMERRGAALSFHIPQRGSKHRLVKLALLNAEQHFQQIFMAESRAIETAAKLAQRLKLSQVPRRIECVDISNLQGSDIVGAVVVFEDGTPRKQDYKRYKISQQGKPDDFAAIAEVVSRRLARAVEENDLPDLLLIDGGPGQLAKALESRNQLKLSLTVAAIAKMRTLAPSDPSGIAKKPERLFIEGEDSPIELREDDSATQLIQRIRDEAHRFVISFHRNRRSRRVFSSILDGVPGIGADRRARLLRYYGSVEDMRSAAPQELARIGRMSQRIAERLLEALSKVKETTR